MTGYVLGLDVGTTTISWTVLDAASLEQMEACNRANDSSVGDGIQNPDRILDICLEITDDVKKRFKCISAVGITGQMHGIVLTDEKGNSVSPLYTWQYKASPVLCSEVSSLSGYKAYSGYGVVTLLSLVKQNKVPEGAVSFCSIMDYVAMKLCKNNSPVVHSSVAASFGLYDLNNDRFDFDACKKIGLDCSMFPEICVKPISIGKNGDSQIFIPIGDNQASFLGVVEDDSNTICVNCGTGSQVSVAVEDWHNHICQEIRPYFDGKYLLTGSALCGGKAYAVLENFFRQFGAICGLSDENVYDLMEKLVSDSNGAGLFVDTRFCGTRDNPEITGTISGITEENFVPGNLIYGFFSGMAQELFDFYRNMNLSGISRVAASGNAVRRNPVFTKILSEKFGMSVEISDVREEAAVGACLFVIKKSQLQN